VIEGGRERERERQEQHSPKKKMSKAGWERE